MLDALIQLGLFTAKFLIVFILLLAFLLLFIAIASKGREKYRTRLVIKNLNKKYEENTDIILSETATKKEFKKHLKDKKQIEKEHAKRDLTNIYVLNFNGDMRASAVDNLREEITAILNVAKPTDEVVLRLESPGGVVHGYGLAAAQLMRLRKHHVPLTVCVDKVAASGGYMMACVANKILSAPFAILGSIGVIVQMPNFHRLLQDKHIDVEQHTAGEFKRTITMFGENTKEGRQKLQEEIEDVHQLFKNLINEHRPQIDIQKVSTGEHWLGQQALLLNLVDEIKTSDDYLLERSKDTHMFEIHYEIKKPLLAKFSASARLMKEKFFAVMR